MFFGLCRSALHAHRHVNLLSASILLISSDRSSVSTLIVAVRPSSLNLCPLTDSICSNFRLIYQTLITKASNHLLHLQRRLSWLTNLTLSKAVPSIPTIMTGMERNTSLPHERITFHRGSIRSRPITIPSPPRLHPSPRSTLKVMSTTPSCPGIVKASWPVISSSASRTHAWCVTAESIAWTPRQKNPG